MQLDVYHDDLMTAVRERNKELGADNISGSYRMTELFGEFGEVCNVIKKLERERLGIKGSRDTVEHLREELGDVRICLLLVADHFDVPAPVGVRTTADCLDSPTERANKLGIVIADIGFHAGMRLQNNLAFGIEIASNKLCAIGDFYGIDVEAAARDKFNQTTKAVGLSHYVKTVDAPPPRKRKIWEGWFGLLD